VPKAVVGLADTSCLVVLSRSNGSRRSLANTVERERELNDAILEDESMCESGLNVDTRREMRRVVDETDR
jgi:hypothetical protein